MNVFILRMNLIAQYVGLKITGAMDTEKAHLDKIITDLFITPNVKILSDNENFLQHYFSHSTGSGLARSLEDAKKDSLSDASSLLIAGHETTSRLLQFAIMLLAKHPDVLAKLREEITCNRPADGNWSKLHLDKMTYLRKILKESLRLHPPVPLIARMVTQDFALANIKKTYHSANEYNALMQERDQSEDLVLSKGTVIYLAIWQTHRLEDIYEDSSQFNPSRFNTDTFTQTNEEDKYRGAFIPFGLGSRDCIGRFFAMQEAQLGLISLVDKFDFEIKCDRELFETHMQGTLKHKGNVSVEFVERNLDYHLPAKIKMSR